MRPMATRKRRRASKARKKPVTPPPVPVPVVRQPSKIEQKLLTAVERGLDILAEDPERFIRMGEGVIAGGREALRFVQENPEDAKRIARNTMISFVTKMTKKKLRGE